MKNWNPGEFLNLALPGLTSLPEAIGELAALRGLNISSR